MSGVEAFLLVLAGIGGGAVMLAAIVWTICRIGARGVARRRARAKARFEDEFTAAIQRELGEQANGPALLRRLRGSGM